MLTHEYLLSRWAHVQNSDMQHGFVQIWKMSWLPDANSVLGADLVWFDCLMQVNILGSTYLQIIPKVLNLLTWKYCCSLWLQIIPKVLKLLTWIYCCSLYYAYPTPVFFWLISLHRPVVLCWLMLAYRRWQHRDGVKACGRIGHKKYHVKLYS